MVCPLIFLFEKYSDVHCGIIYTLCVHEDFQIWVNSEFFIYLFYLLSHFVREIVSGKLNRAAVIRVWILIVPYMRRFRHWDEDFKNVHFVISKPLTWLIILILLWNLIHVIWLYIASCTIWLWKLVSYIKGGIRKQDPEANIWAQERREWGVEKVPQWGTS